MAEIKHMDTAGLVNLLADNERMGADISKTVKAIKTELQARGLSELDDRNTKYIEYYGDGAFVGVGMSQSLEILNYAKLASLVGIGLLEDNITRKEEVKYDVKLRLKEALTALFTLDFTSDFTLEELLKKSFPSLEGKKVNLLLKKLKGDYKKDKALLKGALSETGALGENREDIEEELYYIHKIKNYEKICIYFNPDEIVRMAEEIKKCVIVEETVKITLKYEEETA